MCCCAQEEIQTVTYRFQPEPSCAEWAARADTEGRVLTSGCPGSRSRSRAISAVPDECNAEDEHQPAARGHAFINCFCVCYLSQVCSKIISRVAKTQRAGGGGERTHAIKAGSRSCVVVAERRTLVHGGRQGEHLAQKLLKLVPHHVPVVVRHQGEDICVRQRETSFASLVTFWRRKIRHFRKRKASK